MSLRNKIYLTENFSNHDLKKKLKNEYMEISKFILIRH